MLRFFLVTLVAAAMALALGMGVGSADERWIIQPGPEAANAQKLGASEVERAQKLAKEKHFAEAVAVLEAVARKWPAAVHDCNLALAYLRDGSLTRAQLVWDLGALRNGVRPKWCTGEVSAQLAEALRKAGYVPTTIDVTPWDAVVEVSGIAMRGMTTVWLPAGTTTFNASAPGMLPQVVPLTVAAPMARVKLVLQEPKPDVPDAGVKEPVVTPPVVLDAGVATVPVAPSVQADAGVPESSGLHVNGQQIGWRTATLVTTLTFAVAAGICGYLTYDARQDANRHYVTDPEFDEANEKYKNLSLATSVTAGAAVVSAVFFAYFAIAGDAPMGGQGNKVKVGGGPGVIGVTYGDSW